MFSKHSLNRTVQKLWHFFTSLNFPHTSPWYLFDFFITARKKVGLWGLLYLRVVCQTTLGRKKNGNCLDHMIFWSYGWRNKLLPQPRSRKEKETRKWLNKLHSSKNICLVLGETVETQEGGKSIEPYFIKRQGANDT